ncbi:hypothetical protein CATYP_08300 [Corynebacterium atypicum]|uniref:Uncharacterized protein n=1 Tax=Corynebacterium atypicum TaxID=191610 RepID=A0ABM5QPC3_9CORY|nr:hypothetical protein [Corynebacterium atypicum]AIG64580.1 hypothetical protein CATYP_08300 [Corynebacterium atypicum]
MSQAEYLDLYAGGPGLQALLGRAVSLDASALARLQQLDGDAVDVFVTTPFSVVAARRVNGVPSRDRAVVSAQTMLAAVSEFNSARPSSQRLDLGTPRDPFWPGALPPAAGFREVDRVPVGVARRLADKGQALARQFSGPLGPPRSLLDQTVVTVTGPAGEDAQEGGAEVTVEVPMRVIFTCTSLGLIPGFNAGMDVPRYLRVSHRGRWLRVDCPFGAVYYSRTIGLV